ncbi:hypothetical protein EVAR_90013_1 [Eumeta japonica]|uniref:Uncharacterized protein n=1 Tax=Eumeta variegata TaxID=151549 RepID=A0A4C2A9C1_EUMVA|nr:hypothetical protein EVAR_90013_1 [Eumeta japonica]
MARRCDSNTAQYERNRSFGHLVHALGRAAGGAKLPSAGLCLNASKAVASLAESGKDTLAVEPRVGRLKQCDFTSRIDHHGRFDVEAIRITEISAFSARRVRHGSEGPQ